MEPVDGVIRIHIFLDRTSVEVFGNGGQRVMTDLIFPLDATGAELLFLRRQRHGEYLYNLRVKEYLLGIHAIRQRG